jgi:hypothetical protein
MTRYLAYILAVGAVAALSGIGSSPAQACSSMGFDVGANLNVNITTPKYNEDNTFQRYSVRPPVRWRVLERQMASVFLGTSNYFS